MPNGIKFILYTLIQVACIVPETLWAQWHAQEVYGIGGTLDPTYQNWTASGDRAFTENGERHIRNFEGGFVLSHSGKAWNWMELLHTGDSVIKIQDVYVLDESSQIVSLGIYAPAAKMASRNLLVLLDSAGSARIVYQHHSGYQTSRASFYFPDRMHGFYLGDPDLDRKCAMILTTSDGGLTWIQPERSQSLPFESGIMIQAPSRAGTGSNDWSDLGGEGYLLAAGQVDLPGAPPGKVRALLQWTDWGNSWKFQRLEFLTDFAQNPIRLFAAASNQVWFVVRNNQLQGGMQELFRTSNGGLTWEKIEGFASLKQEIITDLICVKPEPGSSDMPFVILQTLNSWEKLQDAKDCHTYISFDTCRSIHQLDTKSPPLGFGEYPSCHLTFYSTRRGYRSITNYSTGIQKVRQTYVFSYPQALAKTFPKITDTVFVCRGGLLNYGLPLPVDYYWSGSAQGVDTISLNTPLAYVPAEPGYLYLFTSYHKDSLPVLFRKPFPDTLIQPVYFLCPGQTQWVHLPELPGQKYVWNQNQVGEKYLLKEASQHWLRVEPGYFCDTLLSFQSALYPAHSIHIDTGVCMDDGDIVRFDSTLCRFTFLLPWTPASLPGFRAPGLELVYLEDSNQCLVPITLELYASCPPEIYIPNAFSPHSRLEANRLFHPHTTGIDHYELRIYNGWGGLVYFGTKQDPGWDGTYRGVPAQAGTYFYHFTYEFSVNKVSHRAELSGTFILLQ